MIVGMDVFDCLKQLKWSDNLCTVGWSNIHAYGWTREAIDAALFFCPRGHFTVTSYVDGDERRAWADFQRQEKEDFGAPVYVIEKGAYFDFPMDNGALHLMQALGLVDELMVMIADGARHRWPEPDEWRIH